MKNFWTHVIWLCVAAAALLIGTRLSTTHVEERPAEASSDPKQLALKGTRAWLAFQAGTFAEMAGEQQADQEKFFNLGLKNGHEFLAARKSGEVKPEDVLKNVGWGVAFRLQGPSDDFILGRIYEAATDDAVKKIFTLTEDGVSPSVELKKSRAALELQNMHADALLGE